MPLDETSQTCLFLYILTEKENAISQIEKAKVLSLHTKVADKANVRQQGVEASFHPCSV